MPANRPGTATVMPYPKIQFFTSAGAIAASYKVFFYLSGTSTKTDTFADSGFAAANANPVVLDSAGRATIFLDPAYTYKIILATPTTADPPAGGDIVWTVDGVGGVPFSATNVDVAGTAGETLAAGDTVYLSTATGRWLQTDSNSATASVDATKLGMVVQGGAITEAIIVRTAGRYDYSSGSLGSTLYLSSTAGELTTTAPTGGENLYAFGVADTANTIIFPVQQTASVALRTGIKTFGYSSGQSNAGGGGDTQLTSYDVPLQDNYFDTPGAALILEGTLAIANNADADKAFKCQIGAGTVATLWASADAGVAGHIVPFRMTLYRRTTTTASITGIAWTGAAATGAPTNYLVNTAISVVDWTSAQTLKFYAASTTAATVTLTDLIVYGVRSYRSATV